MLFNKIHPTKGLGIKVSKNITKELNPSQEIQLNEYQSNFTIKPKQKLLSKGESLNPYKLKAKKRKKRNVYKKSFRRLRPFRKARRTVSYVKKRVSQRYKVSKLSLVCFIFIGNAVILFKFNTSC